MKTKMKLKVGFTEQSNSRALFDLTKSSMHIIYKICKYASDRGVGINYEGSTYLGWDFTSKAQYIELDRIFKREVMTDLRDKYSNDDYNRLNSYKLKNNDITPFTVQEVKPESKLIAINGLTERRLFNPFTSTELKGKITEYANNIGIDASDNDYWLFKNTQQYINLVNLFNDELAEEYSTGISDLINLEDNAQKLIGAFKNSELDITAIERGINSPWLADRITFKL